MSTKDDRELDANTVYNQVWISHVLIVVVVLFIQNYREYGTHAPFTDLFLLMWAYIGIAYVIKRTCNDILQSQPASYLYSNVRGFVSIILPLIPVTYAIWGAVTFEA